MNLVYKSYRVLDANMYDKLTLKGQVIVSYYQVLCRYQIPYCCQVPVPKGLTWFIIMCSLLKL